MANKYRDQANSSFLSNLGSGVATGVSTGASIGSLIGGIGAPIGAIIGGIVGIFTGGLFGDQKIKNDLNTAYDEQLGYRNDAQYERAKNILSAKSEINNQRSYIDSIYGSGTYDIYDQLFADMFNLADNGTLSDIFENASVDKFYGEMESRLSGSYDISNGVQALSLSDLNDNYQSYLTSLIRGGDGAVSYQYRQRNLQERRLISSYYDDISAYNLEVAQSFEQNFLQRVSQQAEGEQAMGEASLAQATSGIRQTGSGNALTIQQQFQNDISTIAYTSALNYAVRQYELNLKSLNESIVANIEDIRLANSADSKQHLADIINSINEINGGLFDEYIESIDYERTYDDVSNEIEDINEVLMERYGGNATRKPTREEIF